MKLTFGLCLLLNVCFLVVKTGSTLEVNYSKPILPDIYQKLLGPGFATKFFATNDPLSKKYNDENIVDVYNAGFKNLRLRVSAKFYAYPYDDDKFAEFLVALDRVVNKCLEVGVMPVVSWAHRDAENYATEEDERMFYKWWKNVAETLKDKDYRLSFNLVTELSDELCRKNNCTGQPLKHNIPKFTRWMTNVTTIIRNTGGKNEERIVIYGGPQHDADGLCMINESIYDGDEFVMAEYHTYAAGPTNKTTTGRFWEGCGYGTPIQRGNLVYKIELANNCSNLKKYWGAWMVQDNKLGGINQTEGECFAEYFVTKLKEEGIPWSLNALDNYYNTKNMTWLTGLQEKGPGSIFNMSRILDVIKKFM